MVVNGVETRSNGSHEVFVALIVMVSSDETR